MRRIKFFSFAVIALFFATTSLFAKNPLPVSRILLLNYDANSEAMGGTIASKSANSIAFTNMPSANYSVLANRADFGGIAAFDGIYGAAVSLMIPTKYGNFSGAAIYNNFNHAAVYTPDLSKVQYNTSFYLNYTYPFSTDVPVYADNGGLGLTVKMHNFALEKESASSFSFDLGGHYNLDMLVSGLWGYAAFKNIGNDITIGDSKIIVPQTFHFALRYELPHLLKTAFTGEGVYFFSDEDNAAASIGAEISPFYPITLKIGYRYLEDKINQGITAGLFINMEGFNLGYSFTAMDSDYFPKHTINVGFMFGNIRNEIKAFDYYLGYNFNRAKEAYKRKDYITARQQLEEILAIYPDHVPSKKYLKKIVYDMDMYDRNLDIQMNKWLRKAAYQLHRNNLVKARNYYYRVLGMDPENQEAEAGLAEISEKLYQVEIRENRKKNEKKIIAIWEEAMGFYNDGNFVYAKDKFKELLEIDPENAAAKKYLDHIETKVGVVTAMQADLLFTQAMEYYNMADYDRASKYFNAVYTSDPSRTDAKEYYELSRKALNLSYSDLSGKVSSVSAQQRTRLVNKDDASLTSTQKVQKEMETYYRHAVELFNNGRYEEALKAFVALREKATSNNFYDLNSSIRDYSQRSRDAIAEKYYNEAMSLVQKDKLEEALSIINKALDYNEKHQLAIREKAKISEDIGQKYYEAGIKAYASGNKRKAIENLNKSLEYSPDKAEAVKALDRIKILGE